MFLYKNLFFSISILSILICLWESTAAIFRQSAGYVFIVFFPCQSGSIESIGAIFRISNIAEFYFSIFISFVQCLYITSYGISPRHFSDNSLFRDNLTILRCFRGRVMRFADLLLTLCASYPSLV